MRLLTLILPLALSACAMSVPIGKPYVQLRATEWRVVAVNGRPTPPVGDYWMRFGARNEFGARLGCNHMGGRYQSLGGTLTVTNLNQTLMGCPEPAGTFESQASAILAVRTRADMTANGRVVLSNTVGTIALERTR